MSFVSSELLFAQDLPEDLEYAHELHEAIDDVYIEGEGASAWIREWIEKFNVVSWGFRFYRGASLEENQRYQRTTYDVLFLMAFSHPIEMASGPSLISAGLSNEWPGWLIASLGAGGAVISMPGLDPLCIVLIGSYFAFAPWREAVGWTRQAVLGSLFWGARASKLNVLGSWVWNSAVSTESRIENFIDQTSSRVPDPQFRRLALDESVQLVFLSPDQEFQFSMKIHLKPGGKASVEEIAFPSESNLDYTEMRSFLRGLGWNLRRAFAELSSTHSRHGAKAGEHWPFYVDHVLQDEGLDRIVLKRGAIQISRKHRLRSPLEALRRACSRNAPGEGGLKN